MPVLCLRTFRSLTVDMQELFRDDVSFCLVISAATRGSGLHCPCLPTCRSASAISGSLEKLVQHTGVAWERKLAPTQLGAGYWATELTDFFPSQGYASNGGGYDKAVFHPRLRAANEHFRYDTLTHTHVEFSAPLLYGVSTHSLTPPQSRKPVARPPSYASRLRRPARGVLSPPPQRRVVRVVVATATSPVAPRASAPRCRT